MAKGSQFERDMCREFSLWLSHGKRDDLLWRTSQSGGRATTRRQKGAALATKGCYGDICTVDTEHPAARLWGQHVSLELKRGYSGVSIQDLVDLPHRAATRTFEGFIAQAVDDALASSRLWLLVWKRDKREPVVIHDARFYKTFEEMTHWSIDLDSVDRRTVYTGNTGSACFQCRQVMRPLSAFFDSIRVPEEVTA